MPFLSSPRRAIEWKLAIILIFSFIIASTHYMRQLEREARLLLVESLARSLSVQLFITQQQISARGQSHNPEYLWQIDESTYITVRYGYPAANDINNLMYLFEPALARWDFELDVSGIMAILDGRTGCGIFYRPALGTQTPATLEVLTFGC